MSHHRGGPLFVVFMDTFSYNVVARQRHCMRIAYMAKTHPLGFRVEPEVKAAIEQAAKDDVRSVSSMVEKILTEWLREHGYLDSR
jgi:hypothetical protein